MKWSVISGKVSINISLSVWHWLMGGIEAQETFLKDTLVNNPSILIPSPLKIDGWHTFCKLPRNFMVYSFKQLKNLKICKQNNRPHLIPRFICNLTTLSTQTLFDRWKCLGVGKVSSRHNLFCCIILSTQTWQLLITITTSKLFR